MKKPDKSNSSGPEMEEFSTEERLLKNVYKSQETLKLNRVRRERLDRLTVEKSWLAKYRWVSFTFAAVGAAFAFYVVRPPVSGDLIKVDKLSDIGIDHRQGLDDNLDRSIQGESSVAQSAAGATDFEDPAMTKKRPILLARNKKQLLDKPLSERARPEGSARERAELKNATVLERPKPVSRAAKSAVKPPAESVKSPAKVRRAPRPSGLLGKLNVSKPKVAPKGPMLKDKSKYLRGGSVGGSQGAVAGRGKTSKPQAQSLGVVEKGSAPTRSRRVVLQLGFINVTDGSFDVSKVRAIARSYRKELIACSLRNPAKMRGSERRVRISYTINSSGRVSQVGFLKGKQSSQSFKGCIEKNLSRWRFPRPQAGHEPRVKQLLIFSE